MTILSSRPQQSATLASLQPAGWEKWRDPSHYSSDLPLYKKAIERWVNDFKFRDRYEANPSESLRSKGFICEPLDLDIIIDPEIAKTYAPGSSELPILPAQYRQFINTKKQHCLEIRDIHPQHQKWAAWRHRMVASTFWRDSPHKHAKLVHAPFSIELTRGCTVGCWFCGVDAEKYQGHVEINGKTEAIWRSLLTSLRSVAGIDAAQHGFCYWATDPLDHPDYEWFLEEFHSILNYWPQTTTAQGLKHAPRMKRLFATIKEKRAFIQRFSMTRSTDFDAIHDYFTPEELFLCELIPQYDDRLSKKATAGRVRKLVLNKQQQNKPIPFYYNLESTGSIACVSGFLGNLVQQSLKLITPCEASDRWPLGYRILDERHFDDPNEIETLLLDMLENSLNDRLMPTDTLTPFRGVKFSASDSETLCLSKFGYSWSIPGVGYAPQLAELLSSGSITVNKICAERSKMGVDPIQTCLTLTRLFNQGIFDEQLIDDDRAASRHGLNLQS